MKDKKTTATATKTTIGAWRKYTKFAPVVCAGLVFAAIVADNVYLHVRVSRQADVIEVQQAEIRSLSDWVEHTRAEAESSFGHRIARAFRSAGRKTVSAFHKADSALNPQAR